MFISTCSFIIQSKITTLMNYSCYTICALSYNIILDISQRITHIFCDRSIFGYGHTYDLSKLFG